MSNRAQRRAEGRKAEKPKTYTLTLADIQKIKDEAVEKATLQAILYACAFSVLVLHDHFGFRERRLDTFIDRWLLWVNSWYRGEVTHEELVQTLHDMAGLRVEDLEQRRKNLW